MTCECLGVDPFGYFQGILAVVGTHPAPDLDQLLPDRCTASSTPR